MLRIKPTEAEMEILHVIWDFGPSTVRQVNERLQELREVGYTTTLKIMQIMHQKEILKREKKGKLHVYFSGISREKTQSQVVQKLVDGFFHGSTMRLAMHALGSGSTNKEEIEEIRILLNSLENKKEDGDK